MIKPKCDKCGSLNQMMYTATETSPGIWELLCWSCRNKLTRTKEATNELTKSKGIRQSQVSSKNDSTG